jgi:hypothetical protein
MQLAKRTDSGQCPHAHSRGLKCVETDFSISRGRVGRSGGNNDAVSQEDRQWTVPACSQLEVRGD